MANATQLDTTWTARMPRVPCGCAKQRGSKLQWRARVERMRTGHGACAHVHVCACTSANVRVWVCSGHRQRRGSAY
eukprot:5565172-Alexandrium_andersonii.AAC.1